MADIRRIYGGHTADIRPFHGWHVSRMSAVCQPYIRRMSACIHNLPICPVIKWLWQPKGDIKAVSYLFCRVRWYLSKALVRYIMQVVVRNYVNEVKLKNTNHTRFRSLLHIVGDFDLSPETDLIKKRFPSNSIILIVSQLEHFQFRIRSVAVRNKLQPLSSDN